MEIAVIDCGTNTFTLSLFDINETGAFTRSLKQRHYVDLAEEGILSIGPKAFQRGVEAFRAFGLFLADYPTIQVQAIGTAALRRASNQKAFLDAAKEVSGILIQVIDGAKEADLIYKGVRLAAPLGTTPSLIMDIGGGSVEFIIADKQQLYWAKSYPIGVAVLFNQFHQQDPIGLHEIEQLEAHLETILSDLIQVLSTYEAIEYLIGAAGSFDVLDNMTGAKKEGEWFGYISTTAFQQIYQELVHATFEERLAVENLSTTRAKLIVMSVFLINFVHQKINTATLVVSDHAIREGLIEELLNT